MKRLLLICGLALMLVPAALAGRSTPTVAVNPNPVVAGSAFTVSGCGYSNAEHLWVGSVVGGSFADADSSGCFAVVWLWDATIFSPLPQQVQAIVYDAANGKIKSKALAAVSFWVVAPA